LELAAFVLRLGYTPRVFLTQPKMARGLDALVKLLRTELTRHAGKPRHSWPCRCFQNKSGAAVV